MAEPPCRSAGQDPFGLLTDVLPRSETDLTPAKVTSPDAPRGAAAGPRVTAAGCTCPWARPRRILGPARFSSLGSSPAPDDRPHDQRVASVVQVIPRGIEATPGLPG